MKAPNGTILTSKDPAQKTTVSGTPHTIFFGLKAVANHFTQPHEHDSEDLRQDLPGLKAGVINEQIGPGQDVEGVS